MVDADCRVLSWNLWWRFGDWAARQPLIDDVVGNTGADLIALQEVYRTGHDDQTVRLAEVGGLAHREWSPNREPLRWRERLRDAPIDLDCGVALLSRWPIVHTVDRSLPAGDWPPGGRTALGAEPDSDEIRRFCGLFTEPFIDDLAFQDAWRITAADGEPGWTWRKDNPHVPDGNPNARIDYVFIGLAGRISSARLVGLDTAAGAPSDHAGVLVDLRP